MNKILLFSLCIIPSLILMWYVYIKDKVDTGVLNENSLEKVKYTFISNEGEYRIQSFEKIK